MNRVVHSWCFVIFLIQLVYSLEKLEGNDGATYIYEENKNKINRGIYSATFAGIKKIGNDFERVAIKLKARNEIPHGDFIISDGEYEKNWKTRITNDYRMHKRIGDHRSIPKCYDLVSNVLITELLGSDLYKLRVLCGERFSLETALMIGIDMLTIIEDIHKKGIVFKNMKLDNIAVGYDDPTKLYIFNFGESQIYLGENGKHVQSRGATRREDILDIGLLFASLLNPIGGVPYRCFLKDLKESELKDVEEVVSKKCSKSIAKFLIYAHKMKFEDQPDYKYLKGLFLDELKLKNEGQMDRNKFDWMKKDIPKLTISFEKDLSGKAKNASTSSCFKLFKGKQILR